MELSAFDTLKFFEELKAADVPEKQAKAQADALRSAFAAYDASRMQELATKADLRETELVLRKELKETESRLQKEIHDSELRLLKWQFGIGATLVAIMAKGFGWLGF